jgi:hypothetical protein
MSGATFSAKSGGEEVLVSLTNSSTHPWIHIRQVKTNGGVLTVNADGLFLRIDQFNSLMCQLRAIDLALLNNHQVPSQPTTAKTTKEEEEGVETTELFRQQGLLSTQAGSGNGIHFTIDEPQQTETSTSNFSQQTATSTSDFSQQTVTSTSEIPDNCLLKKKKGGGVEKKKKRKVSSTIVKKVPPVVNDVSVAYGAVMRRIIDNIVRSSCLGCALNKPYDESGYHTHCANFTKCVEMHFEEAMGLMTDDEVWEELGRTCPPKAEMCLNLEFCKVVKSTILHLC